MIVLNFEDWSVRKPSDDQIAIADQEGSAVSVARRLGMRKRSVLFSRKLTREYRAWEARSASEAALPFAERRVDFMPLSRRTINALRHAGIETGAQLTALSPLELAKMRNVGVAVRAEIGALLTRAGFGKE
jgi:hypothetical protein